MVLYNKKNVALTLYHTHIKLINFSVTLYRTVQKLKLTGKGGVGYGEVSCHLQGSPGAGPTLIITEIVITKSIKNEGWKWGDKDLGKGRDETGPDFVLAQYENHTSGDTYLRYYCT